MAKPRSVYRCTECGHDHPKWAGRCEACGEWNTIAEEPVTVTPVSKRGSRSPTGRVAVPIRLRDIEESRLVRWSVGIPELDFVLGAGLVPGSMTLVGGRAGDRQVHPAAAGRGPTGRLGGSAVLYASGEESPEQVRLRAARLLEDAGPVHVVGETRLEAVLEAAQTLGADLLIIDSIQTIYTDTLEGAPGNVGQVRECAARLMRFAKETGAAVIVVGHVTKGGGIAGPKTLEHIVDTVLYFEGEATLDHRLLRATKNRFGSVDEIGVFSMTGHGLEGVPNPSALFLAARAAGSTGSAVTALMEGTRPVLVEVQALAARSGFGTPQRVATGLDQKRLAVILAVLERRAATSFSDLDVFVQVTAGVRLTEPAADLAVAAALVSSVLNKSAPPDALFLGELGLGGEIRPVAALERRLTEAGRLGFRRVFASGRGAVKIPGLTVVGLDQLDQLVGALAS